MFARRLFLIRIVRQSYELANARHCSWRDIIGWGQTTLQKSRRNTHWAIESPFVSPHRSICHSEGRKPFLIYFLIYMRQDGIQLKGGS